MNDPDPVRRGLLGALAAGPLLAGPDTSTATGPPPMPGPGALILSVADFGAVGDGEADDQPAIQRAIAAAAASGGGTVLFPRVGPWRVARPIELDKGVILRGVTPETTIRKTGTATARGTDVDAVIYVAGKARFRIENIGVIGTRAKGGASGGFGFYLRDCSYFDVEATRADYCSEGYRFTGCYTFGLAQATGLRCARYAFSLLGSCTSFVLRNTTSWGCGGGWSIVNSAYGTLLGCACDHSDAGGKPDDPFGDSGGDYRRPAFIFDLSGSKGITIVAPGCENSFSNWLYCEGTQATILNPYIYNLQAHSPDWRLIQLRGATSYSNVTVVNPFGFDSVVNAANAPRAVLIENPALQKLYLSGRWRVNAFAGPLAYPAAGLHVDGGETSLDLTQTSMVAGPTAFLKSDPSDVAGIVVENGIKSVSFRAERAGGGLSLPLASEGMFLLNATGGAAAETSRIDIVERGGSTPTTLRSWRGPVRGAALDEWFYLAARADRSLALRIVPSPGTEARFTKLSLVRVGGQA